MKVKGRIGMNSKVKSDSVDFLFRSILNLKIVAKTGASTATISRVNRSLNYGCDGYELVFGRLQEEEEATS